MSQSDVDFNANKSVDAPQKTKKSNKTMLTENNFVMSEF
jgi:hypothetical protein